jgi:hypothetical protein
MNALVIDDKNFEALQTLASLRISQSRKVDAIQILESLFRRVIMYIETYRARNIKDELENPQKVLNDFEGNTVGMIIFQLFLLLYSVIFVDLPTPEQCIAFVKLLLECSTEQKTFSEVSSFFSLSIKKKNIYIFQSQHSLQILQHVLEIDDENPEAW